MTRQIRYRISDTHLFPMTDIRRQSETVLLQHKRCLRIKCIPKRRNRCLAALVDKQAYIHRPIHTRTTHTFTRSFTYIHAYTHITYLTFAGRSYFTEHGRRSGVIIYHNRLCNISGYRSARNTNEKWISILSRSGNRYLVVAIACKYILSRWRPKWRQNRYLCVSGHRSATKTNRESISIILRSANRSPVLAIAFKCNFPRWRSK